MSSGNFTYPNGSFTPANGVKEEQIEYGFIGKLQNGLKYEYRADIRGRAALEKNFREKFEALNRVRLTESEFARLLDEIVTPDVYAAATTAATFSAPPMTRWTSSTSSSCSSPPPSSTTTTSWASSPSTRRARWAKAGARPR